MRVSAPRARNRAEMQQAYEDLRMRGRKHVLMRIPQHGTMLMGSQTLQVNQTRTQRMLEMADLTQEVLEDRTAAAEPSDAPVQPTASPKPTQETPDDH